mmetsp:Transcript_24039/g.31963  ORF Transcript_24039/g.31963 Transcript_24039/m.31963 type:complete len:755 (-) Transcript_24039:785-3049(-)
MFSKLRGKKSTDTKKRRSGGSGGDDDKEHAQPSQEQNGGQRNGVAVGQGVQVMSGPGAVSMGGQTAVFRVTVPENVRPGEEFQVYAGMRIVRVRCPNDSRPGQSLQITVPIDSADQSPAPGGRGGPGGPGGQQRAPPSMPDSEGVRRTRELDGDGRPAYTVEIPRGVRAGQQFSVTVGGQQLMVTCPPNTRPGMSVRIVPPNAPNDNVQHGSQLDRPPDPSTRRSGQQSRPQRPKSTNKSQMFEVVVPRGVRPGEPFALLAGGVRVLVTCPTNAQAGQKIRFNLPVGLTNRAASMASAAAKVKLSYDKDGWTRTIRVSDMKFQWVRFDDKGDVDLRNRFDTERSAYVRKLVFDRDDGGLRRGNISLVPASEGLVDSKIKSADNRDLVSYADIAAAQIKSFEEKTQWFQETCSQLCVEWNEGHMRMNVRREYLLGDSMEAVMSLSRKDLRKVWRFEFIGEVGIDAGGLAREWFQLVTEEVFDPDMGLWQSTEANQMMMQINPASEISCPDDHLIYFRFLGRVMGKALFDRQLVAGHMVQHLYKHMLGWPVTFSDLEHVDEEYYNSLKQLKYIEDVSMMCLDFTTMEDTMGAKTTVELVKGGEDIEVDNSNLPEYLEACLKYRMMGRVKPQMNELLMGFFDVIPEPLLTIFDFQELELLMCGLPVIDMDDWKEHTEYSGEYDREMENHEVCRWFWEVVEDFDQEMKARLLQFVTGEFFGWDWRKGYMDCDLLVYQKIKNVERCLYNVSRVMAFDIA